MDPIRIQPRHGRSQERQRCHFLSPLSDTLSYRSNKNTERTASTHPQRNHRAGSVKARTCGVAREAAREDEDSSEEQDCSGSCGNGRRAAARGLAGAADPGGFGGVCPVVVRERVVGPAAAGVEEAAAGLPVLRHQAEVVLLLVVGHHHGRDGGRWVGGSGPE